MSPAKQGLCLGGGEEHTPLAHQHPGTDSSGSSRSWSLLCFNSRCNRAPSLTGAESLTGPQITTHNVQGLMPLLEGRFFPIPHSAWVHSGLARLRATRAAWCPPSPASPVPQPPVRQNKPRTVMRSATVRPPPSTTPARAESFLVGGSRGTHRGYRSP